MMEHRGRVSGQLRYVVLEVVVREPGVLIVVSGYGKTAQWFRNIIANPNVRVWNSRIRGRRGHATVIPARDVADRLESYRQHHPRTAMALGRTLGIAELGNNRPLPEDIGERLPLVQIKLEPPTP